MESVMAQSGCCAWMAATISSEVIRVKSCKTNAKAEVYLRAAGKNLLFRQTVARRVSVIPTDATIVTVIFAVVRKLNESAHVHVRAVVRAAHLVCGLFAARVIGVSLRLKFRIAEVTLLAQTVDQSVNFICGHEIPPFFNRCRSTPPAAFQRAHRQGSRK